MFKGKGILTEIQKEILFSFGELPESNFFYLSGGTALSEFYLGHRLSYDLDFFTTEKELIPSFLKTLEEGLEKKRFSVKVVKRFMTFGEFEIGKVDDRTKIHIASESPFRFEKPLDTEFGVKVNDYKDIMIDKFLTFFGRTEPRDAIDLFFILKKEKFWSIAEIAIQKDPGFDLYWMAVALEKVKNFPDEIEKWPVQMISEFKVSELKEKFLNLAKEIMDRIRNKK